MIALNGSQHYEPKEQEKHAQRTKYLESQGLQVLRFTNLDILQRFSGVCELVDFTVKQRVNIQE